MAWAVATKASVCALLNLEGQASSNTTTTVYRGSPLVHLIHIHTTTSKPWPAYGAYTHTHIMQGSSADSQNKHITRTCAAARPWAAQRAQRLRHTRIYTTPALHLGSFLWLRTSVCKAVGCCALGNRDSTGEKQFVGAKNHRPCTMWYKTRSREMGALMHACGQAHMRAYTQP